MWILWFCDFEGDNKTLTLDVDGSPEVLVLGTSDSQGCEELINQFVYEVGHLSRTLAILCDNNDAYYIWSRCISTTDHTNYKGYTLKDDKVIPSPIADIMTTSFRARREPVISKYTGLVSSKYSTAYLWRVN